MPTMCGGRPPTERSASSRAAPIDPEERLTSSAGIRALVGRKRADRLQHVSGAGENDLLQHRRVRHRAIKRSYALDWRVEVFEQLFGNARGDFRAESAS